MATTGRGPGVMTNIAIGSSDCGAGWSSGSRRTSLTRRCGRSAQREGAAGVHGAARLGDLGGDGVAALLHAAGGAEVQADELAREGGDRLGRAAAAGGSGEGVGGGDRVDRVAEVAHREDDDARADLGATGLDAVLLLRG